jgi:hypothetical protein
LDKRIVGIKNHAVNAKKLTLSIKPDKSIKAVNITNFSKSRNKSNLLEMPMISNHRDNSVGRNRLSIDKISHKKETRVYELGYKNSQGKTGIMASNDLSTTVPDKNTKRISNLLTSVNNAPGLNKHCDTLSKFKKGNFYK